MKTSSNTTQKLYTIFTLTLLLGSGLSLLADSVATLTVPPGASSPLLEIVESDYTTASTTVFGRGAAIYVKLTHNAMDTTIEPDVVRVPTVKSETSTGTPIQQFANAVPADARILDLIETGPKTGVFTGSFRVDTASVTDPDYICDVDSPFTQSRHVTFGFMFGDACLKVQNDAKITIELSSTVRDTVIWRAPEDGSFVVDAESLPGGTILRGYDRTVAVKVDDSDLDKSAVAETYGATPPAAGYAGVVQVFSDSDLAGETVRLVETGGTSGVFLGSFGFESTLSATPNGKLFVRHGDRIQAFYVEANDDAGQRVIHTLPTPALNVLDSWFFHESASASMTIGRAQYFVTDPNVDHVFDTPMTITVDDRDEGNDDAQAEQVDVRLIARPISEGAPSSTDFITDPRVRVAKLTEVGGLSGLFIGDVWFVRANTLTDTQLTNPVAQGGKGFGANWIRVNHTDRIYARYEEPSNLAGSPVTLLRDARFFNLTGAQVILGTAITQHIMVGTGTDNNVIVLDPDANMNPASADQIIVKVRSTSDLLGISLTLTEDGDNTGRFVGSFRFVNAPATSNPASRTLLAADRDEVSAEYQDARGADGLPARSVSENRVIWRTPTTGAVSINSPIYAKRAGTTGQSADFKQLVHVVITDPDQNDPFVQDTIPISISRAVVEIFPNVGLFVSEAGGTASFQVRLNTAPTAAVTLPFSTSSSAEACFIVPTTTCSPISLTFNQVNWNIAQTITLQGKDDRAIDGNRDIKIITGAATSADPLFSGLNPADVGVTNFARDPMGFIVTNTTGQVTDEAGTYTASFSVVLKSQPVHPVLVPIVVPAAGAVPNDEMCISFTTTNNPGGCTDFAELTFNPTGANAWNIPQFVRLTGEQDAPDVNPVDGVQTVNIALGPAESNDPEYNGLSLPSLAIKNIDDEATCTDGACQGVVFNRTAGNTGTTSPISGTTSEYGSPHDQTFNVRLAMAPADSPLDPLDTTVTVTYNLVGPDSTNTATGAQNTPPLSAGPIQGDFVHAGCTPNPPAVECLTRTLTFTTANWNIPQPVTIRGRDDSVADGTLPIFIRQGVASQDPRFNANYRGSGNANGIPPIVMRFSNLDNDGTVSFPTAVQTLTEDGGTARIRFSLTQQPLVPVLLNVSVDQPSLACVYAQTAPIQCKPALTMTMPAGSTASQALVFRGLSIASQSTEPVSVSVRVESGSDARYLDPVLNPVKKLFLANFHDRQYPGAAPVMATEVGTDSGTFLASIPTGFNFTNQLGVPSFDPGPNGAAFRVEYTDQVAADGNRRTSFSSRATWHEGPDTLLIQFENENGDRVNSIWQPSTDRGSTFDETIYLAAYGDKADSLEPWMVSWSSGTDLRAYAGLEIWIRTNSCTDTVGNKATSDAEGVQIDTVPDSTVFRYAEPVTITRMPGPAETPLDDACNTNAEDNKITSVFTNAVDTLQFIASASQGPLIGQTVRIGTIATETISVTDATGAVSNSPVFGTGTSGRVRITGGNWNRDTTARDIAVVDLHQEQRAPMASIAGYPGAQVTAIETAPDSNEFIGSFSFGARQQLSRGTLLTATAPEVGRVLAKAPSFVLCSDGEFVYYMRVGTSCSGIPRPGDVRLTPNRGMPGGSIVQPRDPDAVEADAPTKVATPVFSFVDRGISGFQGTVTTALSTTESMYIDTDNSGDVSIGDVRLRAGPGTSASSPPTLAFEAVHSADQDCPGTDALETCDPATVVEPLVAGAIPNTPPVALDNILYLDVNRNSVYDHHDMLYLDIDNRGTELGKVSVLDYRLTGTLTLDTTVPALTPAPLHTRELEAARMVALPAHLTSSARSGLYWYPAQDARFDVTPGVGAAAPATLRLVDDRSAGVVFREVIAGDGVDKYNVARGNIATGTGVVYVSTRGEMGQTATAGFYTVASVGAGSREPITDRNLDGSINCGPTDAFDVTLVGTAPTANAQCVSTEANLRAGQIFANCPSGGEDNSNCAFTLSYMARANPVSGSTKFHYTTSGREIDFGAVVARGDTIRANYQLSTLEVTASSLNTGETETFPLVLEAFTVATYTGTIPTERLPVANNKFLHVAPGTTHSDRIRLVYGDNLLADGRAGSPLATHFRSTQGLVSWLAAGNGELGFWTPTFEEANTGTGFGPQLAVQVTDIDRDTSDQPDVVPITARNGANNQDQVGVLLRETGPSTGVFRGTVAVNRNALSFTDDAINILSVPGNVIVTYQDPMSADNNLLPLSANAVWRPTTNAFINVTNSPTVSLCCTSGKLNAQTAGAKFVQGSDGRLFIGLEDSDANRNAGALDTIEVQITSESDPSGERITLLEQPGAPGVFLSNGVQFETTRVPNNGRVFALDNERDGEELRLRYIDATNAAGIRQTFEPTVQVFWNRTFDGVVSWNQPAYVGVLGPTDDGASGTIRHAILTVEDGDLNEDPRKVDVTPATSFVRVGRFSASAADKIDDGSSINLRLFETGANTGVFIGRVSFSQTNLKDGNGLLDPSLPTTPLPMIGVGAAGASTILRAQYVDPNDARGVGVTFTSGADWHPKGLGLVTLDRAGYNERTQSPQITLIDAHLDTSATSVQRPRVRVTSTAQSGGLEVELVETGENTGIFRGTFNLIAPTGSDATKLKVADQDTIQVIYQDANPSGTRTATAVINIGDLVSPTTTLTTSPVAPDGLERPGALTYFVTDPEITLTANEPVTQTLFKTSDAGAQQVYPGPFRLAATFGEGRYDFVYFSEDASSNVEVAKIRAIGVDLTEPSQRPLGLVGKPAPGGSVLLTWSNVPLTADPLEFYDYVVFRDDDLETPIANTSLPSFQDLTLEDELPHTYRVAVRDQAGHMGPLSAAVSVIPDNTVPRLFDPTVSPNTFDSRVKPGTISVSVSATDLNLVGVTASLDLPNGTVLAKLNLTRATPGGNIFSGGLTTANVTEACTCTVNLTAIDTAGNLGILALVYRISGPDNSTPEILINGISGIGEVVRGQAVTVEITDNVGLLFVQYKVDGVDVVTVPIAPAGSPRVSFTIPTSALPLGLHTIDVFADDTAVNITGAPVANRANRSASFNLVLMASDGPQLPPVGTLPSFLLPTTAQRQADGILVEWTIDTAGLTQTPVGFQVWRASSPFTLIANVTDPNERSFLDATALPGKAYRYVVSYYTSGTGRFASLSDVPGYPGSDEQVEGSGPVGAEGSGTPQWVWVILMVFAILAVAILVSVAIAARRNARSGRSQQVVIAPPEQQTVEEAPTSDPNQWAEAPVTDAGEVQTHRLKCPECQHRFEVQGVKPIVTNCPNCGRKGILR